MSFLLEQHQVMGHFNCWLLFEAGCFDGNQEENKEKNSESWRQRILTQKHTGSGIVLQPPNSNQPPKRANLLPSLVR